MAESLEQITCCDNDQPCLEVLVENKGWSNLKPVIGFFSSRSSGTRRPFPLRLSHAGVIPEDNKLELRLSEPAFDLGLGCFDQPSQVACASYDEPILWWTGYHEIKIGQEIFDGRRIYGFEEIDLDTDKGEYYGSLNSVSGGREFLEKVDNLEAVRPTPKKRHTVIPSDSIWDKANFGVGTPERYFDLIDEAVALEGTRYYEVNDVEDSTSVLRPCRGFRSKSCCNCCFAAVTNHFHI
ncbi:hypothetical protein GGR58DRAFT_465673 [Xylaria digitata]|nr:hypothetical protein GGR58DRAFT_465673 [Xylaria digitata]